MATTPKCHVRILRLLTHEPMNASIYSNAKARTALPPTITIYCFPFTAYRQRSRQPRTAQTLNDPHSIAADSNGNLYVTETLEGNRVQKFTFKGMKQAVLPPPPAQPH